MRVDLKILQKLNLSDAAERVTTKGLDRLPVLVSERCLHDRKGALVQDVLTAYASGTGVTAATFSMPRRGSALVR